MMKDFCSQAQINKTEPKKHEGYNLVKKAMEDKLLKAKHLFWISLAQDFQPFLTSYQADRPLVPFLSSDLEALLRVIMGRFVKEGVMTSATSYVKLVNIDVSDPENTKPGKFLDIGLAARRELTSLSKANKITALEVLEFEKQCKLFLLRATEKMLEKCPLKYRIVRCLKCLNPQQIAASLTQSVKLFEKLLHCLIDANRVKEADADNLKREYQLFLTNAVHGHPQTLLKFKNYDKLTDERIDSLLATMMKDIPAYAKLWELVKCLLVLSHGQAGVERGFSVNKELMQFNFKERSIVALRVIDDQIKKCGGVLNMEITQELRNAARAASSVYRNEQKKQQEKEKAKLKEDANKEVNVEISVLKTKRKRILEDTVTLKESVDELMERAEKERKIVHVTKANSFKRTIKEMDIEVEQLNEKIESLKKKLKH